MTTILITMGGVESFEETVTAIRATGARGVGGGSRQFLIDQPMTPDQVAALWNLNTGDRDNPVRIEFKNEPETPELADDVYDWWHAENDKPRDPALDEPTGRRMGRRAARPTS